MDKLEPQRQINAFDIGAIATKATALNTNKQFDPAQESKFTWEEGDIEILNAGKGNGKPSATPEQLEQLKAELGGTGEARRRANHRACGYRATSPIADTGD